MRARGPRSQVPLRSDRAQHARSGKEFTELARKAEALGFSTLFVPDHFVDHELAPTVALAHAAAVTDTLRVGPLVLGNDYKHPVVLAREAATLDLLSDGRLELGIGAGWMTVDYEKAGMPLDSPGVRIARLAESITVLKGLFADGPFTFHGEHYRVTDLDGQPKPVQRPHPPFIIGGGGPKILALAAREAQIVGINANLRSGDGTTPDAAQSLTSAATDQKLAVADAGRGIAASTTSRSRRSSASCTSTDDTAGDRRRDGRLVRRRSRRRAHGAGDARRHESEIVGPARTPPRALADVVRRGSRRRHRRMRADRRAAGGYLGTGGSPWLTKQFRFGVQVSQAVSAARGATRRARSKTSATRRCSCPTTSARSSRRCPRSRWRPRTRRRCASAALVFDNDYKHPAILAKEAATIDLLCDGRLELGIGAGWMKTDYDALGLPYDPPAVRVDRFEEALQVIKRCFTGETVQHAGRALPHHRLRVVAEARAEARTADPHRRRRQARAVDRGREADIVGINPNLRAGEINASTRRATR